MRSDCRCLIAWLALACLTAGIAADRNDIDKVKNAVLHESHAYQYLEELSNGIGPRLTGSPEAAFATQWARAKMEVIGLKQVHLESWQLARGWKRVSAQAEMVAPFHLPLQIASYGWSGSTKTDAAGEDVVVVDGNRLLEGARENAGKWAGKILLVAPAEPDRAMTVNAELAAFASAAAAAHAIAVIKRDTRPGILLTHTEPLSFPLSSGPSRIAVVDIAEEHQKLLESLVRSGRRVRLRIDVENQFSPGPVDCANIVGEIPGYQHPEQIVVVAAHLDSWDLGTGATDDGFGTASVLAAAEAMLGSGLKPRRTIRFVLFTGEEQGLLGSQAYVQRHRAELQNILCAFALDWGQGAITKFPQAGHQELAPALERLAAMIEDFQKIEVIKGYLNFTDAYSFTLAGVPGIAPLQDSPGYSLNAHSAADTLDKVDPEILVRDSAILALAAFWIADDPIREGEFWTPEKTAEALIRDHQRAVIELPGMWPFAR